VGATAIEGVTYDEYLALEAETGRKHEYDGGVVTMMTGGSFDHAVIITNLSGELRTALRGGPRHAIGSELKVWIGELDQAVYPDASVLCGPPVRAAHDRHAVVNPSLVAEVLSPGCRDRDTGSKLHAYRRLETVQEVLLVDSEAVWVVHCTRESDGTWTLRDHKDLSGELTLRVGTDVRLKLAHLYENTELVAVDEP